MTPAEFWRRRLDAEISHPTPSVPTLRDHPSLLSVGHVGGLYKLIDLLHSILAECVPPKPVAEGTHQLPANGYNVALADLQAARVGTIVEALLAAKQGDGLSTRYIETLRTHLQRFAAAFDRDIREVRVAGMEDWLRSLRITARTRNNIRGSIVTLFHFARKHELLPKGYGTEADDIAKAKDYGSAVGILAPDQFAPIVLAAPERIRLFFVLGAFAGLRSSEVLRLDWREINLDRRLITVAPEKAKTATRRLVPILPNLEAWLAPFRSQSGALFKSRRDADRAIKFAKACNIQWPNNALRHSYATYRIAATADVPRVAIEMGSSPQKLIRHYRELADETEAQAWFSITPDTRGRC